MKIRIEFDSMEELETFRGQPADVPKSPVEVTVKNELSEEKNAESEPQAKPEKAFPKKEDVRNVLQQLNRKTGKNTTKEICAEMGFTGFSQVPEDRYEELLQKAKEAMNA